MAEVVTAIATVMILLIQLPKVNKKLIELQSDAITTRTELKAALTVLDKYGKEK